jgi:phytoene/squalene synthetase
VDLYAQVSQDAARLVTNRYSTSFSMACRLFAPQLRQHIYNIYGLVRLADEIVDTYTGLDQRDILDALEVETAIASQRGYSSNLIVHAFALTAREYGISASLIEPFFASMRQDITKRHYDVRELGEYVFGSAEVVGLMCLRVFTGGRAADYDKLKPGAQALGAAFQKVNFLRDLAADHDELGRTYFPGIEFGDFSDTAKRAIEDEIAADFAQAHVAINQLPPTARSAVELAYVYYLELFNRIRATPAATLKTRRIRVATPVKLWLYAKAGLFARLGRGGSE